MNKQVETYKKAIKSWVESGDKKESIQRALILIKNQDIPFDELLNKKEKNGLVTLIDSELYDTKGGKIKW